jgi:DNA-binding transcriptional LysR family regulator
VQEAAWFTDGTADLPPVVRPHDIAHYLILTTPSPSPGFQQTTSWFSASGLEPKQISLSNSITVIAHLVAAGVGIAILPRRLVQNRLGVGDLTALQCRPQIEPSLMCAAYRSNDWRPAVNAVVDAAQTVLDQLDWLKPI